MGIFVRLLNREQQKEQTQVSRYGDEFQYGTLHLLINTKAHKGGSVGTCLPTTVVESVDVMVGVAVGVTFSVGRDSAAMYTH